MAVITPEEAGAFLEKLPIGEFYGIGSATEEKMKSLGIYTGKDLKEREEIELVERFGKTGRYYYRIVRGIDNRQVKAHRIRKSIGKERTFSEDVEDLNWIRNFLDELAEKVSASMKKKKAAGKTVTLKVRYADFETLTRSTSFSHYIDSAEDIAETAKILLEQTQAGKRKVRLLGITLSNLNLGKEGRFEQLTIPFE
jgi:DNA polymerase-4